MALNSVFEARHVFVQSILGKATLPMWDKMLVDLQHEELRRDLVKSSFSSSNNISKQVKEEENVALTAKGPSEGHGEQQKKAKDLSKVKYFRCGELGHYKPNVLSGRRKKRRSRTNMQHQQRSIGCPPGWRKTSPCLLTYP